MITYDLDPAVRAWRERANEASAQGFTAGVATICPVHLRPLRPFGGVEPCRCPHEGREGQGGSLTLHGLESLAYRFTTDPLPGGHAD